MNKPIFSIVAAIGKNRELGAKNKLLWHIPEDLKHFKKLTLGHTLIMGRKTFQSIGRPLPKRKNIIITRHPESLKPQFNQRKTSSPLLIIRSIKQAIKKAKELENKEVFIIGGADIFNQTITMVDRLYLTIIEKTFPQADVFFPQYKKMFRKISQSQPKSSAGYRYRLAIFKKLKKG